MINQVFSYSEELAKKSGSKSIVLKVLLLIVINVILYYILPIIGGILFVFTLIYSVYQIANNSVDTSEKTRSYAIDENGRIFEINLLPTFNNAGSMGQLVGGNIGGAIGSVMDAKVLESINNNIDIINNPEIISKLIETKPGEIVNIIEILKVYSIEECKTNFKVNCDLVNLTNDNKIFSKTTLRIKKCYTNYETLIEELKKKEIN